MTNETRKRIPGHLRQFVVNQNYDAYDCIDQAVWRFVLLQTYHQLKDMAHPAYVDGLRQTGLSIERIPKISEMDACLSEFGWGAVCVNGFIPPRAFQEFQALGIMTIAADIRTPEHLAYTPAPDIIHESAGHSPIVPDPHYRAFLSQFGAIGCKAFSSQEDQKVFLAIKELSVIKECPNSSVQQVAMAELQLKNAVDGITWDSESALLSRLHWWTVEYGLVGTPEQYKIYGAGLLSSVGESFFCHQPHVTKLPLSADCIQTTYDITKPQPQLFVVPDFEELQVVLEEVSTRLAYKKGGIYALDMAVKSGEIASILLNSDLEITGMLKNWITARNLPAYLQFQGPCALSTAGKILEGHSTKAHLEGFGCPVGMLEGGHSLSKWKEADLKNHFGSAMNSQLKMKYQSGVSIKGHLNAIRCNEHGYLRILSFTPCTVRLGDEVLFQPEWGVFDLAIGESVVTAYAGASDPDYWPESDFSDQTMPSTSPWNDASNHLNGLYHQALSILNTKDNKAILSSFSAIQEELQSKYTENWLLRWNLLESLTRLKTGNKMAAELKSELLEIEKRHFKDAPITMGLKQLGVY